VKDTTAYILATVGVIAAISYAIFSSPAADAQMHPAFKQYSHLSDSPLSNSSTANVAHTEQIIKSNCSGVVER
jgi:hypothetical protein